MNQDDDDNIIILPTMRITKSQHEDFIQALEKHTTDMTGNEWHLIATELEWTMEDVKTYAFYYFHQIAQETQTSNLYRPATSSRDQFRMGNVDVDRGKVVIDQVDGCLDADWTYEECVLFDNLLLKYLDDGNGNGNGQVKGKVKGNDLGTAPNPVIMIDIDSEDAEEKPHSEIDGRWRKIASMMPNKSARACMERYDWYQKENK